MERPNVDVPSSSQNAVHLLPSLRNLKVTAMYPLFSKLIMMFILPQASQKEKRLNHLYPEILTQNLLNISHNDRTQPSPYTQVNYFKKGRNILCRQGAKKRGNALLEENQ